MQEYDFRRIGTGDDECAAIAQLFRAVWPAAHHLTIPYIQWLYTLNPSGTVIGVNAWSDGVLAGHYAVIPIRASFYGEPVKAALSLNTAVHPEHQGRGLFTKLARQTYDLAKEDGVHHIVGVANANSTPGFTRKLEFELIEQLDVRLLWRSPRVRPLRELGAVSWSRVWEPDDLRWRLQNPSVRYTVRSSKGCRQILSPTGVRGISAVLKLDDLSKAAPLDDSVVSTAPYAGLKLWMGVSSRVEFPSLGGMVIPNRLKKSPLNLIVRLLQPGSKRVDVKTTEFETIDFDAY
ncbi:MAG: GNAT family N-acetyltransferase [Phycisphaerae bacterium]|nr:GNAT family N-acetyltransferase [Phycisphaerae bacterium]